MSELTAGGVAIDDTFAEAFDIHGTALLLTTFNAKWAVRAVITMTGFVTFVIACGSEAGIDRELATWRAAVGRRQLRRQVL